MTNINFPQLPFVTREMLSFGSRVKFELVVRSNQTTQRTIEIRGFTRSGRINIKHIGTSTTVLTETINQIDDIPIMLAVAPTALANTHGDLYVSVNLRIEGNVSIPLLAGFVTQAKGLSWPNTNLQDLAPGRGNTTSFQIPAPSAGNNLSFTIPSNRTIKLRSLTFKFTTDSNVADRQIHVEMVHQGNSKIFMIADAPSIANSPDDYTFANFGSPIISIFNEKIFGQMPAELWLSGEDTLDIIAQNIRVGDLFSVVALNVEEFFEGA